MKSLVLFLAAAVWLQLPTDGESTKLRSLDFSQFVTRRSNNGSSEESEEGSDQTASDAAKGDIQEMSTYFSWRSVMLLAASPDTMANPHFRNKWSVTVGDDEMKLASFHDEDLDAKMNAKLKSFFESNRWKALVALRSTRAELLDADYREQWGLKDLPTEEIRAASEDGNFFKGPQWIAWLDITNKDVDEGMNDWEKLEIIKFFIMDISREIMRLEDL